MIFEAVIATTNPDATPHLTPLGYRLDGEQVLLAPFVPSRTLDNLRRTGVAVLNFTDDVRIIAGCLTGRREWPTIPLDTTTGWRLEHTLAHQELEVVSIDEDEQRPTFRCLVGHSETHGAFRGFNRAQGAVVECAILVSRLDWLEPDKVERELGYLNIAIEKTAGAKEVEAWQWLLAAVAAHPRHRLPAGLQP